MATAAKFKFEDRGNGKGLPWHLEQMLIFKFGFHVDSRTPGDYVIMEKVRFSGNKTSTPEQSRQATILADDKDLSDLDQTLLRRQCSAVVAMFLHPEQHLDKIKVRLNNIKQIQPAKKAKFVEEWTARFLDEIGDN